MRAIVTVIGRDRVGIIASVCSLLSQHNVNVLDISKATVDFAALAALLEEAGREQDLSIRVNREDIFDSMHRI